MTQRSPRIWWADIDGKRMANGRGAGRGSAWEIKDAPEGLFLSMTKHYLQKQQAASMTASDTEVNTRYYMNACTHI